MCLMEQNIFYIVDLNYSCGLYFTFHDTSFGQVEQNNIFYFLFFFLSFKALLDCCKYNITLSQHFFSGFIYYIVQSSWFIYLS